MKTNPSANMVQRKKGKGGRDDICTMYYGYLAQGQRQRRPTSTLNGRKMCIIYRGKKCRGGGVGGPHMVRTMSSLARRCSQEQIIH